MDVIKRLKGMDDKAIANSNEQAKNASRMLKFVYSGKGQFKFPKRERFNEDTKEEIKS